MSYIDRAGKDRTGLLSSIANGDDVVERLPEEFLDILRSMVSDIYADFMHGLYGHRIQAGGMSPGTFGLEVVTCNEAE